MVFEIPFHTLQYNTEKIWIQLSAYDTQTLNRPQAPGKWSAIQHMVHLNKSERSFVILLTKALRNNTPLKGSIIKIKIRGLVFKMFLNGGVRIKAPKVIEPADEVFLLENVKQDFVKTRAQLYQLLSSMTPEQHPKFWVHHQYLKELRAMDLLGFLTFHQNHHRKLFSKYLK